MDAKLYVASVICEGNYHASATPRHDSTFADHLGTYSFAITLPVDGYLLILCFGTPDSGFRPLDFDNKLFQTGTHGKKSSFLA